MQKKREDLIALGLVASSPWGIGGGEHARQSF